MIRRFEICLKRLVYCAEYKLCSHYFIPEVNFFENRFSVQQHNLLLAALHDLNEVEWESLLQTRLCDLYSVIFVVRPVYDHAMNRHSMLVRIFKSLNICVVTEVKY